MTTAVKIRGLDINQADAEELTRRIDGIGERLAATIAENRRQFGPFLNIHDLGRVPGIGPAAFTRITGLRWREDAQAKREELLSILGRDQDGPRVKDIAQRFAAVSGFEGCLIADSDGELLAECWSAEKALTVGAYAPYLIQKIAPMLQTLQSGRLDMMTLFISEQAITLVPYKSLVFVAVHQMNRFSRKQLRLAQQVTETLGASLLGPRDDE